MKVITFFNDKGGVGKTAFSILFASWLAYEKKEKVRVFDFDYPSHQIAALRKDEILLIKNNKDFAKLVTSAPYPISEPKGYAPYTDEQLKALVAGIRSMSNEKGYLVIDFPGSFKRSDASFAILMSGLVDLVVFPIDSDTNSSGRALFVNSVLNNPKRLSAAGARKQDTLMLWNRETNQERRGKRDYYAEREVFFNRIGVPVCTQRAHELLSMRRRGDVFGFIQSTVCYPKKNIQMNAPWLEPLLQEIKERLDGDWVNPFPLPQNISSVANDEDFENNNEE